MTVSLTRFRRIRAITAVALVSLLFAPAGPMATAQELTDQLIEPDEASASFFGASVAIDGDWAFVGAPFNSESGAEAGAVYVYRFNGVVWSRTQKLFPAADAARSGWFGYSIAVDDSLLAVGSPETPRSGAATGTVCIFRLRDGQWTRASHFTAPDAAAGMAFGASVAIDGDRVLIGAPADSQNGPRSGAAYTYRRESAGWTFEAKLRPDSARALDAFGKSVALDGARALIGAPWTRHDDVDAGSAFIFERRGDLSGDLSRDLPLGQRGSTWRQTAQLVGREGASGDMFGESVSLAGDLAAVGASRADTCEAGAVYVYRESGGSWAQERRLTAPDVQSEHLFGASVSIRGNVLLVGAPFFRASQAPGSVYRFDRNDDGWIMTAEIRSPAAERVNHFGQSVCWSGDTMITGAFREPAWPGTEGSAFIYAVPDTGPFGYTLIYPW